MYLLDGCLQQCSGYNKRKKGEAVFISKLSKEEIEKWFALALIGAYQDKTGNLSKKTMENIKEKYNYEMKKCIEI